MYYNIVTSALCETPANYRRLLDYSRIHMFPVHWFAGA